LAGLKRKAEVDLKNVKGYAQMLTQAKTEADKIVQNPPKVELEESKKASLDED
jgi:hypothetical protein